MATVRTFGLDQFPTALALDLEKYLASPSGQTFLAYLTARTPQLSTGLTIEQTAMQARDAKGWSDCIQEIINLSKERPEPENPLVDKPMNMSLDDDRNESKRPQGKV